MAKYSDSQNRRRGIIINDDSYDPPISIPDYAQYESRSHAEHFCPQCNVSLSRLIDKSQLNPSYYCTRCSIEFPIESEVKVKSQLSTSEDDNNNDNPLVGYPPEPTLQKNKKEYQGGFKVLSQRGTIKITDYKETNTKGSWRITTLGKRGREND